MSTVRVVSLWAVDRGGPAFLPTEMPTISWAVVCDTDGWEQAEAELELRSGDTTDTACVRGPTAQKVAWPFASLGAYSTAEVRVTVRGTDGSRSEPSAWTVLRTGPLGPQDWHAPLVTPDPATVRPERGTARFRTEIDVPLGLVGAVLSLTAHGIYEAVLDGVRVGDEELAPGWTAYRDVLTAQTHDVTEVLLASAGRVVVLGVAVAEGWYGERYGFDGVFARAYEGPLALAAQLRLETEAGVITWVSTGEGWTATAAGPVLAASIYQGESHDARLDDDALTRVGAALPGGRPVVLLADVLADPATGGSAERAAEVAGTHRIVPSSVPPVRVTEVLPVREVLTTPSGATVLDLGQNIAGRVRLRVDGPAGTQITLRHAEVLEDGELGTRPLRFAKATDTLVLSGEGPLDWAPRFTYHGFRYVEVTGWPGELDPAAVVAEVMHTDMVRTGHLRTSDPLLDRLHANIVWGLRGNMVSLPTDCPQRDERFGWTGDIQVFAPTAGYLYDVSGLLGSWLRDLAVEQARAGLVPFVVPNPLPFPPAAAAAWGDAATLVPDALLDRYGDLGALAAAYPSMRDWVETVRGLAGVDLLWTGGFQFGDWLDPSAPPDRPADASTDPDIVASAYFFRSTSALARAARLLGHEDDAAEYSELAEEVRSSFVSTFVTPGGRMVADAHTAYALAIGFGIVEAPALRARLGDRLAELVRSYAYRIRTGFVGTPLITAALDATGHTDLAYRMLLEQGVPSWLYPVTMGATTVWERWDSMLPDGSINPGEMTSFNHYALGAVADWMHRRIGGIAPAEPGSRVVDVRPVPGGGLTSAGASFDTGYGVLEVAWRVEGSVFLLEVEVPANMRARVTLPDGTAVEARAGRHALSCVLEPPPEPAHRPWSLDESMARFVDDPRARAVLEATCAAIGFDFAEGWTSTGRWRSDSTVRQSLLLLPPEGVVQLEAAIAALND